MTRDEAQQLTDSALNELAAALEAGHSDQLTQYLAMLARFPRYSFGNLMMIMKQRPDATHVAGFTTWKKLKRYVKRGEQGIAILAPLVYRKQLADEQSPRDAETDGDQGLRGFKVVYVFDVSQTDGEPLAEFATVTGEPNSQLERLLQVIAESGIILRREMIPNGAQGAAGQGTITVRPDLDAAEEFSVLVHEYAHLRLHHGERRSETTCTIHETEAEAVAFVVCQGVGLQTGTAAGDYIQLYRGSKETLMNSLSHIQPVATELLTALSAPGTEQAVAA